MVVITEASPQKSDLLVEGRRPRGWRFFVIVWAAMTAASAGWALCTPLFTSPDESAHVVHAAAVVRGQLTGTTIERPGEYYTSLTGVRLPGYYADGERTAECMGGRPGASAACSPGFADSPGAVTTVTTSVGRYPPLYYVLVGAPSLVLDGSAAVLGMRLASAVVGAAAIAGALTSLLSAFGRRGQAGPWLAGGLLAATPMTVFLVGTVNPSGFETALGLLVWAVLLPVALVPGKVDVRARFLGGVGAAAGLLMVRPSSPVLAALIALCLLVLSTRPARRRVVEALRGRGWLLPTAIAAAASAATLAWLVVVRPTDSLGGDPDPKLDSPARALAGAAAASGKYLQQQVGVFGWLDTPAPLATWLPWAASLAALVMTALALGRRRRALVVLAVLTLVVPAVTQVPTAADLGLIWQGRYLLPLSVGVPLLAVAALTSTRLGEHAARSLAPWVVGASALAQVSALAWVLWRYGWGLKQLPLLSPAGWTPVVGAFPALGIGVAGILTATAAVLLVPGLRSGGPAPARRRGARRPTPAAR